MALKVDNVPAARPLSGLDQADVVFEEPIEGGITRFVAVFQCHDANPVGSLRSARAVDEGILDLLGRPVFVHVGGIDPVLAIIRRSSACDQDLLARGGIVQSPPGRYAPFDTFVSTESAWALCPSSTEPPSPLFGYSQTLPLASPVGSVHIPYSQSSNATWTWNGSVARWQLSYNGTAARLASGSQVSFANVIVQQVQVTLGPWIEDSRRELEVQSELVGNGTAMVFRNGVEVLGTWRRASLRDPLEIFGQDGRAIKLEPGPTWLAIVPTTIGVTSSPRPP